MAENSRFNFPPPPAGFDEEIENSPLQNPQIPPPPAGFDEVVEDKGGSVQQSTSAPLPQTQASIPPPPEGFDEELPEPGNFFLDPTQMRHAVDQFPGGAISSVGTHMKSWAGGLPKDPRTVPGVFGLGLHLQTEMYKNLGMKFEDPVPVQESSLYKAGEAVEKFGRDLVPVTPGYEEAIGPLIGKAGGSAAAGFALAPLGPIPSSIFFTGMGAGESLTRAVEFDKAEKAQGRPGLSQDQIDFAGALGGVAGTTDKLALDAIFERLKMPAPIRTTLTEIASRIGGTAFIEGLQEGGQAFIQNLIEKQVYNPEKDLIEGVPRDAQVGMSVGALIQTGVEILKGTLIPGKVKTFFEPKGDRLLSPEEVQGLLQDDPVTDLQVAGKSVSVPPQMSVKPLPQEGSEQDELGFTSKLEEVLSSFKPTDPVTAEALAQRGVKAPEIEARGLKGKFPKSAGELLEIAKKNPLKLQETTYRAVDLSTEWDDFSIDPGNITYEETVIHLDENPIAKMLGQESIEKEREATAFYRKHSVWDELTYRNVLPSDKLEEYDRLTHTAFNLRRLGEQALREQGTFGGGHFDPHNTIAHIRHSVQSDTEGNNVFAVSEIQSDWGQRLTQQTRDTLAGELFPGADFQQLNKEQKKAVSQEISKRRKEGTLELNTDLTKKVKQLQAVRDTLVAEKKALIKEEIIPFLEANGADRFSSFRRLKEDITDPNLNHTDYPVRNALQDITMTGGTVDPEVFHKAGEYLTRFEQVSNDIILRNYEIQDAQNETPANPLVNTTDAWLIPTLRRLVRIAVDKGLNHIALPTSATVKDLKMGGIEEGLDYAYNEMYPKKLRDVLRKLDKNTPDFKKIGRLQSATRTVDPHHPYDSGLHFVGHGFYLFEITPAAREKILGGQPLYAQRPRGLGELQAQERAKDKSPDFANLYNDPKDDPFNVNRNIEPVIRELQQSAITKKYAERMIDAVDAGQPRYVLFDGADNMLYSATDLETQMAYMGNFEIRPEIKEVFPHTLDPSKISAELFDLPEWGDKRIIIPEHLPVNDVEAIYKHLKSIVVQDKKQALEVYAQLLNTDIRVVPTRGSSFMYGGQVQGRSLRTNETPISGRTYQTLYMKPGTVAYENIIRGQDLIPGEVLSYDLSMSTVVKRFDRTETDSLPVAVDMQRVEPGTFVSIDPEKLSQEQADKVVQLTGMTLAELVEAYHLYPESKLFEQFKRLHEEGILISIDQNNAISHIQIMNMKPVPSKAVVTPYHTLPLEDLHIREEVAKDAEGRIFINHIAYNHPAKYERLLEDTGRKVIEAVRSFQPIMNNALVRLGAKKMPNIVIDYNTGDVPHTIPSRNTIIIPVQYFIHDIQAVGSIDAKVIDLMLHELGHNITFRSFFSLPASLQAQIRLAYQRSLLRMQLLGHNFDASAVMAPNHPLAYKDNYYNTFEEWLAEQYRRHALSDARIVDEIDKVFAKGGRALRELHKMLSKHISEENKRQLFTSSYEFNVYMDYLEAMAHTPAQPLQMMLLADKLPLSIPDDPRISEAFSIMSQEIARARKLLTADAVVEVSEDISLMGGGLELGNFDTNNRRMRLFAGSLARIEGDMTETARDLIFHEAWHGIEDVLTKGERALLVETAKREGVFRNPEAYERVIRDFFRMNDSDVIEAATRRWMENEYIAHLAESRRNGKTYGSTVDRILDILLDLLQRIKNALQGRGFKSVDSIIEAFKRGEITERYNRRNGLKTSRDRALESIFQMMTLNIADAKNLQKISENQYVEKTDRGDYEEYYFFDGQGSYQGRIAIDRNHEIQFLYVEKGFRGKGIVPSFVDYIQKDRKIELKTAQILTTDGYNLLKRRAPERVKYYQPLWGTWRSPKSLKESIARVEETLRSDSTPSARQALEELKEAYNKIPEEAWNDPILERQFMIRSIELYHGEKVLDVRKKREVADTTGQITGPLETAFENEDRKRAAIEASEAARVLDLPKPKGPRMQAELGITRRIYHNTNMPSNPGGYSAPFLARIMDWQLKIMKVWNTIHQVSWKNAHDFRFSPVREYLSFAEQMNTRRMEWISKATDIARRWEKLPIDQADGLSEILFWATEMRYLSPAERKAGVVRHPTNAEVLAEARRLKLGRAALSEYVQIKKIFGSFLDQMETIFTAQIAQRFQDPQAAVAAVIQLRADMQALRAKPYFPFTRFGKYTVTVRDMNDKVVWFSAYNTINERNAAQKQIAKRFGAQFKYQVSTMPERAMEFMGLPGPLLQQIKANMPGLSKQQIDWLDRLQHIMAPEQSFKKRWLERKGTPGYSYDGIRVFAQYFASGASYLSKLEFKDRLEDRVNTMFQAANSPHMVDTTKVQAVADMMDEHLQFLMAPGREWVKIKAFAAHWHLGFSVAAAGINLSQVPMVTYPYLSSIFGEKAAANIIKKYPRSSLQTLDFQMFDPSTPFGQAHEEMVAQGKIDTGQAADLGSFSESNNLNQMYGGTWAQRRIRDLAYYNMWFFSKAERLNREVTFRAAWDLALRDPNNTHVQNMIRFRKLEIMDLKARRGFTDNQAAAFLVAREAIDRTQGIYQSWARPKFLRGKIPSVLQIFLSYPQQYLFMLWNNPGRLKMWAGLIFLYGLSGMPFADDTEEVIRAISRKAFGVDFSPEAEARKLLRELTRGTPLDEVGPDLMINGISRYGYGFGLLPDGWGMPRFDASANGSMGTLVPGLKPLAEGIANSGVGQKDWDATVGRIAEDIAGAGFGPLFAMAQFLTSAPFSEEQKMWEKIAPRSVKAMLKAYRYMDEGRETTRQGGTIAEFDMSDPDDVATVIFQALGFNPTKVTQHYDKVSEFYTEENFIKAQKLELYVKLDQALRKKDKAQEAFVYKEMEEFNNRLKKKGLESMGFNRKGVMQSMRSRQRVRDEQDQMVPRQKTSLPLQDQVFDRYPGGRPRPGAILEQKVVK